MTFLDLFRAATGGKTPYLWQCRLADEYVYLGATFNCYGPRIKSQTVIIESFLSLFLQRKNDSKNPKRDDLNPYRVLAQQGKNTYYQRTCPVYHAILRTY